MSAGVTASTPATFNLASGQALIGAGRCGVRDGSAGEWIM
jgi:hypothetical protein